MTRWGDDPFARGSYAFIAAGSSFADIETLGVCMFGSLDRCMEWMNGCLLYVCMVGMHVSISEEWSTC